MGDNFLVGLRPIRLALWRCLLFAGDNFARAFARARVGVRALAAHRKSATMPNATIASEIHQALDGLLEVAAQIAFDFVVGVDRGVDFGGGQNLERARPAYSVDIGQRDIHPLVLRQFDSSYACHRETLPSPGAACGAGWSRGCARRLRDARPCSSYKSFLPTLELSSFQSLFKTRASA